MKYALCIAIVLLFQRGVDAQPQLDRPIRPQESAVLLRERMEAGVVPAAAFFLVQYPDGATERIEGRVIPAPRERAGAENRVYVGALYHPRLGAVDVRLATILFVERQGYSVIPFRDLSLSSLRGQGGSIDELRSYLLKRREVLRSWELQLQTQQQILQRLRADAEVIGGVGRIIDAKEEKQRIDLEIAAIEGQIQNLERLVELARTRPQPKNVARREQQLSAQLIELAAAARDAELGEGRRRSDAERSLQDKLAIVEETRYEDLDLLRRELQALEQQLAQRGKPQG